MHLRPHRRKCSSIILLFLVQCISLVESSCVMYDVCHKIGSSTMNCVVDDFAPRPLSRPEDAEAQQTLKSICPHLFNGTGDNAFCCSSSQVDNMSRQLKMAANLLSPCPSCFDNFQKLWCEFTCSPRQDEFVQVEQVIEVPARNESYVDRVRYRISERFADTLYDSCKNVMMNGQPALKIMCTKLTEQHYSCPRDEWFKFMGTQDLTQGIPMNIDFVIVKEEQTTDLLVKNNFMHVNGTPCTVPPRFGMSSCPRQHCPQIPVSDFFPQDGGTKEPCNLWGIGCTVVSLVFVCFFCFVVLVCCTTANLYVKTDMNEYNSIPSPKGAFESVADWIERHMKGFFAAYGEFMAGHRLLMIVAGVMVFILTAFGLGFVRFTTDPVELWSAPNSRTRYEKKFFDDNFEPFYRVEQVIMHPKNARPFYHKDKLIGPVFQKEFLREVFKVVHLIRSVTVTASDGSSVNLDDICYRPLDAPHDCMINTPANYFQMNESLLDQEVAPKVAAPAADDFADYFEAENEEKEEKVTYLDHLLECINNPLQLETSFGVSCLGTYGGPIGPELVFGGANETKNYIQSTGITMIFLVTGKTNLAKKAMAWEEGFIDLIKTYNSDLVQISFMAERSISDEIKRESMSDAAIIGLACVLMVLYIMFSLGTYTVDENRLLSMFVHSKILIAMAGVVTIVLSVFSSFGTYSLYGLTVPRSAVFVQFFVLLSIGTNRMFTTIYTVKKYTHSCDTLSELMYNVCGDCLPTMFICSVSESLCFFIGGLIPVPAVRSFALLAAFALLIHFVLHCTIFLPLLTLDVQRELRGTPELMCCMKIETEMPDNDGYVKMVMEKYVAPFIMKRWFRISAEFNQGAINCFETDLTATLIHLGPSTLVFIFYSRNNSSKKKAETIDDSILDVVDVDRPVSPATLAMFEKELYGEEATIGSIASVGVNSELPDSSTTVQRNDQPSCPDSVQAVSTQPSRSTFTAQALSLQKEECHHCITVNQDHDFDKCMEEASTAIGKRRRMDRMRLFLYWKSMIKFFQPILISEDYKKMAQRILTTRGGTSSRLYSSNILTNDDIRINSRAILGPSAAEKYKKDQDTSTFTEATLHIPLYDEIPSTREEVRQIKRLFDEEDWERYEAWIVGKRSNSMGTTYDYEPKALHVKPNLETVYPDNYLAEISPEVHPDFVVYATTSAPMATTSIRKDRVISTSSGISSIGDIAKALMGTEIAKVTNNLVLNDPADWLIDSEDELMDTEDSVKGNSNVRVNSSSGSNVPSMQHPRKDDGPRDFVATPAATISDFASAARAEAEAVENFQISGPKRSCPPSDSHRITRKNDEDTFTQPSRPLKSSKLTAHKNTEDFFDKRGVGYNHKEGDDFIGDFLEDEGRAMSIFVVNDPRKGESGKSSMILVEREKLINAAKMEEASNYLESSHTRRPNYRHRSNSRFRKNFSSTSRSRDIAGPSRSGPPRDSSTPEHKRQCIGKDEAQQSGTNYLGLQPISKKAYIANCIAVRGMDSKKYRKDEVEAFSKECSNRYDRRYTKEGFHIPTMEKMKAEREQAAKDQPIGNYTDDRSDSRVSIRREVHQPPIGSPPRAPIKLPHRGNIGKDLGFNWNNCDERMNRVNSIQLPEVYNQHSVPLWNLQLSRKRSEAFEKYEVNEEEPHLPEGYFSNGQAMLANEKDRQFEDFKKKMISRRAGKKINDWWSLGDHPLEARKQATFILIPEGDTLALLQTPCNFTDLGMVDLDKRRDPRNRLWPTIGNTCVSYPGAIYYREKFRDSEMGLDIYRCQVCSLCTHDAENCPLSIWARRTLLQMNNHCFICLYWLGKDEAKMLEHQCGDICCRCYHCGLFGHNSAICGSKNHLKYLMRPSIFYGLEQKFELDSYTRTKNDLTNHLVTDLRINYEPADVDFHSKYIQAIGIFDEAKEECYRSSVAIISEYAIRTARTNALYRKYSADMYGTRLGYLRKLKDLNVRTWPNPPYVAPGPDWDKDLESLI